MRKRKMIVCALEEEWIARLLERLRQEEWQTQMIDHAETLWEVQAPCSAIMIQEEELTEAYRWRTKDAGDSICLQAFREFAEWQKVPIIVILQQRDDRLEEQLLRAGAAECVCPEQSTDLAACRIARAVSKNVVSDVPMTEWERVIVDSEGGQVQIDGYPIHMSREECILLKRLLQAEGAVVYRDELVENLWSEVSVHSRRRLDGVVQRVRNVYMEQGFLLCPNMEKGIICSIIKRKMVLVLYDFRVALSIVSIVDDLMRTA